MNLAPKPPPELDLAEDDDAQICQAVASYAVREVAGLERQRFFAAVARALGRKRACEAELAAALARELARHIREPWARDGIQRGLELFGDCVDETGRRCVANLVAEYFGWREVPDAFFRKAGALIVDRSAEDLVRLSTLTSAYARLPRPIAGELRLIAAVPQRGGALGSEHLLSVVAFVGEPIGERGRSTTEVPSLGSGTLIAALAQAELGWLAEPGPLELPLVGRPLLWLPPRLDGDLRRLHLLLCSAIR